LAGWFSKTTRALIGIAAALLCCGFASAQDAAIEGLRARVEQLEKQNEELRRSTGTQTINYHEPFSQIDDQAVKDIVDSHLKELESRKKQEEERKKREADACGYEVGSDPKMTASWNKGLAFESAHKDFRMQIGARFQEDWVAFREPQSMKTAPFPGPGVGTLQDGTFMRRLRVQFKGQAWEVTEFNMEFDLERLNIIAFDHMWWGVKDLPMIGTLRVARAVQRPGVGSDRIQHGVRPGAA
jgi:hypothetical protein